MSISNNISNNNVFVPPPPPVPPGSAVNESPENGGSMLKTKPNAIVSVSQAYIEKEQIQIRTRPGIFRR